MPWSQLQHAQLNQKGGGSMRGGRHSRRPAGRGAGGAVDTDKVNEFGGEGLIMRHFLAARTLEAKQNLLAVLLACVFARKGLTQVVHAS